MEKRFLFLLIVSFIFIISCTQQEEINEISPAQEQIVNATIVKKDTKAPSEPAQEVNTTNIEPLAENNQSEEKVKLTFEQAVWKKRIDTAMSPSYCLPVTKVEYPSSYYQGPLIDSHYHLPSLPDSLQEEEEGDQEPLLGKDIKISEIACTLKHEGTTRNFAFFPIKPEIPSQALEIAKRTMEQYPDLFTPFMDRPTPEDPNIKSDVLSEILAAYPGLFQGWGEISLYVLKDGSGRYSLPDSPPLPEIYSIIRKHKIMVYFHPGENQKNSFERVLQQNPDINFIVHGDQIKDDIDYLMGKYPNIYFTINNFYANQDIFLLPHGDKSPAGKQYFFEALENYEPLIQADLKVWESLIEAHPNQVMWGLDREEEVLWTFDRDVGLKLVDYARAFIGRLDPAVQEKFAYKNAERLINRD